MADRIRLNIRRCKLFAKIVFRVWDRQDDIVIRLWPGLAWQVTGIICN